MKSIIGTDELKRQIFLNQDKTIIITGDAGTGKTVTVIEAAEAMGVTPLLFRMQGIESTDITGIPARNEKERCLEYLKPKEIHEIITHPDKRYMLILDECNRAVPEMAPILFQLFEKKIDNKTYDNLIIVAMVNLGSEYDTNIDFTSDKALLRRAVFMNFKPSLNDILSFIKKNNYNETIQKVMIKLDGNYWDYQSTQSGNEKEIEPVTTLGSFNDWNNYMKRLAQIEKRDLNDYSISEMIGHWANDVSQLYFNNVIGGKIYKILVTIKNLWELNIQKDVIEKEKIPDDYMRFKEEILIRVTQHFVENGSKKDYIKKNARHVINLFKDRKEFLMKVIQDTRDVHGMLVATVFLDEFDSEKETDLINAINKMAVC